MSNLKTRIDKAATLAREQERARHDRELSGLPDLVAPIWSHADYEVWEKGGRVDYLPASLCNAITHLRAELPEALRIGVELGRRIEAKTLDALTLKDVSDIELSAILTAVLSAEDTETGNLAALFYSADSRAGDDSAAVSLRAALTDSEREALTASLSPDVVATQEQAVSLYTATRRLLPLAEAVREAMRARGLAYSGNPLRLATLSQLRAAQSAPVGE